MATKAVVGLDILTGAFVNNLKKPLAAWGKFKASIFSVKTALGGIFAGVAIQKMVSIGKDLIESARGQYAAEAQLIAALREKGKYTGANAQALIDYATNLQFATNVQDENIIQVQRLLVQYGLWGDDLQRATRLSLNMAASGKDLIGSAELLGRAFHGNTASLSRYGATLEQVKKAGGGFEGVLTVMQGLFKGQAVALASTDLGKLDRMTMLWGEFKENVGMGLVAAIAGVGNELGMTDEKMKNMNATMMKVVQTRAEEFFYDLAASISVVAGMAQNAISPLSFLMKGLTDTNIIESFKEQMAENMSWVERTRGIVAKGEEATKRRIAAEIKAAAYARGVEDGVDMQQKAIKREVKNMARAGR